MKKISLLLALSFCFLATAFAADAPKDNLASGLKFKDAYTIVSEKNLYTGVLPLNEGGTINAVIAIPAGTTPKWEVDERTGGLSIELRDGKPRVINYLGYPGNFGIVPRTVGNDKEVLAVLVLGDSVQRGAVVKAKIIGSIKLINTKNVETDKLIAVQEGSPLYQVNSLTELDKKFPGVTTIIETWFTNYNGIGKMKSNGFDDVGRAQEILANGILNFKR
ncbi:inorganic diphosphatase [Azotosporobacter soli]|uniref:inorganic diphosphatase n=1 Tax=Azotosporobacter soli TaxID=3055040 RepID=UPI0031FEEF65